ncbi:Hypothetical predicted protein [Paramuricea clavata]|uniref:Uncharacterized protein n=1 Tax=Paramuricea clavata TaxID=317549 RepID=A0A7D9HF29_PARCT|nr:Hypothetical predicted protein [Paramuricea clavata]
MASLTTELLNGLRSSIEFLMNRIDGITSEDEDGRDYISLHLERIIYLLNAAEVSFNIPSQLVTLLNNAQELLLNNKPEEIQGKLFKKTYCRGRPEVIIPKEQLELYIEYNFTNVQISKFFSVSPKTVQRQIDKFQLKRNSYSCMSDSDLDQLIARIVSEFPNCGYRQMRGHLRVRGFNIQWNRIRDSMRIVDPQGILMGALRLTTVNRRTYFVQAPLSMCHIDGNHKLIR